MNKIANVIVIVVLLFVFVSRWLGAHNGLPYLYHWDEVITSTSALNMLKTGDIRPKYVENVYGGFLRYSDLIIDIIHYNYLKITGQISTLTELKTNLNGEFRTLSHPSFYFWNRIFVVLISMACIWLTFLTFLRYKPEGYVGGVATVCLLSISINHYYQSIYTLPNIPLAFWTMFSLLFALKFHQSKQLKHLFISLIAGGIGAATKLSGVLIWFFPFIVFLYNLSIFREKKVSQTLLILLLLFITPFVSFLFFTPSIFIDADAWYSWNMWQIKDYDNPNTGQLKKTPGWENLSFQVDSFSDDLSIFLLICSLLGGVLFFVSRKNVNYKDQILYTILLVGFPVFYTLYFTNKLIAYHRNFIVVYPFLALWFGLFIEYIKDITASIIKPRNKYRYSLISLFLFVFIFMVFKINKYESIITTAWRAYNTPDSRSKIIDYINSSFKENEVIGVVSELMFSEADLKRLNAPYRIFDHQDIASAFKKNTILIVGEYKSFDPKYHSYDDSLNDLTKDYEQLYRYDGNYMFCDTNATTRMRPHRNPTLILLEGSPYKKAVKYPFTIYRHPSSLALYFNQKLEVADIPLKKGEYTISLKARGSALNGTYPHALLYVDEKVIGDFFTKENITSYSLNFTLKEDRVVTFAIGFDNDDADDKEDRNLYVESFEIQVNE